MKEKATAMRKTASDPAPHANRVVSPKVNTKLPRLKELLQIIEKHVPKTGIIQKAKEASKKNVILTRVNITPTMALDLLTLLDPDKQREIRWDYVDSYINRMKAGKWRYNSRTITISREGVLIDGQKTLLAIYLSGTTQMFHIEWGLSADSAETMDIGQPRSAVDALRMRGLFTAHPNTFAAAVKKIIMFRLTNKVYGLVYNRTISPSDVIDWIMDKKNNAEMLSEIVDKAVREWQSVQKYFVPSDISFFYYIITIKQNRKEDRVNYLESIIHGTNLSKTGKTAPIYCVVKYLKTFEDKTHDRVVNTLKAKWVITGWNEYYNGSKGDYTKGLPFPKGYLERPEIISPL